mgnify:FL=1
MFFRAELPLVGYVETYILWANIMNKREEKMRTLLSCDYAKHTKHINKFFRWISKLHLFRVLTHKLMHTRNNENETGQRKIDLERTIMSHYSVHIAQC